MRTCQTHLLVLHTSINLDHKEEDDNVGEEKNERTIGM